MIKIDLNNIRTKKQAINIIQCLLRGLENCYSADFKVCPKCGEIFTAGYICWNCSYDPTEIKDI